jgi:ABC-2 type transport system permease protein
VDLADKMNWKTFWALLARDAHVARRNLVPTLLQTFLQPMMFVFIFGRVMVSSGFMASSYKSLLLPGIMALSMIFTGVWAVAMPLIGEFQFTHEIEDRLLAPIENDWLAIEKVLFGAAQAIVAGLAVIPAAWLLLRPGVEMNLSSPLMFAAITLLVALLSASGGLALGCSISQTQIGLMFSMVLTPMIFFGCTYYPWSALASFPILQKIVLINPLVYASEGLRGTLVPQFPHLPIIVVMIGLLVFDSLLLMIGLRQFRKKAVT